jgi:serine/threonine-protein kinase
MLMAVAVHAETVSARSDFRDIIPQDWRMLPRHQGSADLGFTSPRGDAEIVFKAKPSTRPITSQLARLRSVPGGDITYEREGHTWIVVSGFKGSRIFYRKAMLACGGRAWHYLEFEYPAAQKKAFDAFVALSSKALGAYASSGCRG